jgi:formylglycine-generating enzyme required for sulfatase activity
MDERTIGGDKTVGKGREPRQPGGGGDRADSIGPLDTVGGVPGDVLGVVDRYVLRRKLGQGGFGAVYLAEDTEAGIEVALKALPGLIANSPEELERVRSNFALVQKLGHPHIASLKHLHRVVSADRQAAEALRIVADDYLVVMECAGGSTLSAWRHLFPTGKVPVAQALTVCRQIAAALDYAHGQRIVHRDIKPSNVMVEGDGDDLRVKVLDFGLAAEIRSSMSRVSRDTGDTSGTRPYMAPEQWAGKRQGAGTDQYALACLFHELVSGAVPFASAFETNDAIVMLNAGTNLVPEPLAELDKRQNTALLRALAKDPEERFGSCGELMTTLGGGKSRKGGTTPKGKGWGWFFTLMLLAGLGTGGWYGWQRYQEDRERQALREHGAEVRAELETLVRRAEAAKTKEDWAGVLVAAEAKRPNDASAIADRLVKQLDALGTEAKAKQAEVARLAQLAKEKQQRIAALLRDGEAAYGRKEYADASESARQVLELDEGNALALALREKVKTAVGIEQTAPAKSRAEVEAGRLASLTPADGFGERIKQLQIDLGTADALFDKAQYGSALTGYQQVTASCAVLHALDASRTQAQTARKTAEEAQEQARHADAAKDAKALWQEAGELMVAAATAYGTGVPEKLVTDGADPFAEAAKDWKQATDRYTQAKAYAGGVQSLRKAHAEYETLWNDRPWQTEVLSSEAKTTDRTKLTALLDQHGRPKWLETKQALASASVLERGEDWKKAVAKVAKATASLPEAVKAADRSFRKSAYDKALAAGQAALTKEQWRESERQFGIALAVPGYAEDQGASAGRKSAQVGAALGAVWGAKTAGNWEAVVGAADKVLVLDEGNREATVLKREGQTETVADALRKRLSQAERSKAREDWTGAFATLSGDAPKEPFPGAFGREPLRSLLVRSTGLKQEAEGNLVPSLRVAVVLAGADVTARAAIQVADRSHATGPVDGRYRLREGRIYTVTASLPARGRTRYTTFEKTLAADWKGVRELRAEIDEKREPDPGDTKTLDLGNRVKLELVWCPAGTFTMGSPTNEKGRDDDETQHRVTLTKGFWLGKYEVTQGQWQALMGGNPSHFKNAGADAPVESVSWEDCQEFLKKLNARAIADGAEGHTFRLPTESEWEYACRAGTETALYTGDIRVLGKHNAPALDPIAWYGGNSGVTYEGGYDSSDWKEKQENHRRAGTQPVGKKRPNAWGLHDMIGNVYEWCQDWYGDYPPGTVADPSGARTGRFRVFRGGSWCDFAPYCRSAYRRRSTPSYSDCCLGFRVALAAPVR